MKLRILNIFFLMLGTFVFCSWNVYASVPSNELPQCIAIAHCARIGISPNDLDHSFQNAIGVIQESPRTEIIYKDDLYVHAQVKTKFMHFIDDLEIKAIPEKNILEIRSESRVGISDFGVNQRRVNDLIQLMSN